MSIIAKDVLIALSILACFSISIHPSEGAAMKGSGRNRLNSLVFLSKSSELVGDCNSDPGSIRFWSLENGTLNRVVKLDENQFSSSIAVSSDESLIAVGTFKVKRRGIAGWGTSERSLRCYSMAHQKWIWEAKGRDTIEDCASCDLEVAFSIDNERIIVAGGRYLTVYNARTGKLLQERKKPLNDYSLSTHSMKKGKVFSPTGRYFVVWQEKPIKGHEIVSGLFVNEKVTVWDIEEDERVAYWKKDRPICSAIFSPDERKIILGSMDGYIRIWDLSEQKVKKEWEAHSRGKFPSATMDIATVPAISPDGVYLATFGDGEKRFDVRIWHYATGDLVHEFPETAFKTEFCGDYPMTFSKDGRSIAFQNWGNLCLYDTQTWEEKWCVPPWPEDNGKWGRYGERPGKEFVIR